MTQEKAGKLLAKALDNSSKEEATTAFGMAFTYAERAGIRLSTIHRVEVVETAAGINPNRERELVDKYNTALKRAKELRNSVEEWSSLCARFESSAIENMDEISGLKQELKEAKENASYYEGQLSEFRRRYQNNDDVSQLRRKLDQAEKELNEARQPGNADYRVRRALERSEERERATHALLEQARTERNEERRLRLNAEADRADTATINVELDERVTERSIRCNNLYRDNTRLRELNEVREKENRELKCQLEDAKRTSANNVAEAQDLIDALKEVITARATISEQAHEIAALRRDRDALQTRIDNWNSNSFMRIFGR